MAAPVPALSEAVGYRAQIEFVRTGDGWDIALHRYPSGSTDRPPVILCGGYACNRHFIDFDDRYSLARFLARRGYDTWVVELRGRGASEPVPGLRLKAWTFDDLALVDVPAAISHVRARCGQRSVVWIGHSMGGMVAYAALSQDPVLQSTVAGLVTMATPVAFPPVASALARTLGTILLALPLPQTVPQRTVLIGIWSMIGGSAQAGQVGMNPANIDREAFARALRLFICNVSRAKLQQFTRWSLRGEFSSVDGRRDYRAGLGAITVPALIIAGAMDQLAPPEAVRFAHDRLASAEKTYREFGVAAGDSADYGHVDLIFGRRAPEEVFPVIGDWLERIARR